MREDIAIAVPKNPKKFNSCKVDKKVKPKLIFGIPKSPERGEKIAPYISSKSVISPSSKVKSYKIQRMVSISTNEKTSLANMSSFDISSNKSTKPSIKAEKISVSCYFNLLP